MGRSVAISFGARACARARTRLTCAPARTMRAGRARRSGRDNNGLAGAATRRPIWAAQANKELSQVARVFVRRAAHNAPPRCAAIWALYGSGCISLFVCVCVCVWRAACAPVRRRPAIRPFAGRRRSSFSIAQRDRQPEMERRYGHTKWEGIIFLQCVADLISCGGKAHVYSAISRSIFRRWLSF